jgi:NTP pyrophosphatase (non-canonical NTP hydrolase)
MNIDLNKYTTFVEAVTAPAANDLTTFFNHCDRLDANYEKNNKGEMEHGPSVNVPLLINSAMGMSGEAGEFSEIVKKVVFHGKIFTQETKDHAIKELGDVIWYWANACRALDIDPNEVIQKNVTKLENRYPGGRFNPQMSDERAANDI